MVKQTLYRNNKRKRLMPTKVPTSSSQASVDDDIGSVKRLKEENTTIENDTETEKPPNEVSREPGEVRSSRSPVEPGEVVRPENGEENAAKFMSKFPMTNTDKVSVMQSLLSSFLPPTADNQNNAFWSSFIQKTAAAAAAQNATLSQELNVEDNSDDESACSEKADDSDKQQQLYKCTIDGCQSSFSTEKNRNLHSMNLKLHRAVLESNASMIDCDTGNQSQRDCIFCDKSFPSGEILAKHIHAVHQGQEPMYNDQNFSTQIDSLKNKTPVIA
ncbi:hypothetical protein EB796_016891 [Bugula neritina]|uniref:C2H2-type domain-containing protein n=1 Tax=Bugula neritina TaxID=10212 RepID=A0A7J7JHF3_BUGNE|nr:hypothetical protein EB796_016891 [Bugula neritina]